MSSGGDNHTATNRRGGYGDGGGLTVDNKLPLAKPIPLSNESALKRELEHIGKSLGSTIDWIDRINALIRLEGLIRGGAIQMPTFLDLLRQLKDPLVAQICDRRSAVSRQACHLISVIVAHLGMKFEHLAYFFIPVLIKVLTISVQVMVEAAEECIQSILRHCRSGKLLPKIADCIVSDKCPKIRHHCIKYLNQVFNDWNPRHYERYVEFLFPGLKAALQDASSETREVARLAVAAMYHSLPEKGKQLLNSIEGSLQQKVKAVIRSYKKKEVFTATSAGCETPCRNPIGTTSVNELRGIQSLPQTSAYHKTEDDNSSSEGSLKDLQQHYNQQAAYSPSMTEGPSRLGTADDSSRNFTFPAPPQEAQEINMLGIIQSAVPPAERLGRLSIESDAKVKRNPLRTERIHPYSRSVSTVPEEHRTENLGPQRLHVGESHEPDQNQQTTDATTLITLPSETKSPSLSGLVKQATTHGIDWRNKEEILQQMLNIIENQTTAVSEMSQLMQNFAQLFSSYLQDPHHRVVTLTLKLINSFITKQKTFVETLFPKIASVLFEKLVDGKSLIRSESTTVLQNCTTWCSVDVLLSACISSLAAIRMPKVIPHIFASSCSFINNQNASALQGCIVRQWICQLCTFIHDKNPTTRKAASEALEHFSKSISLLQLKKHLSVADPQEQLILIRNLKQKYAEFLPDFFSAKRMQQKEGMMDVDIVEQDQTRDPLHTRNEATENSHESDKRLLEALYSCRGMKEVAKLDTLTALSDKLCYPAFASTQTFQSEVSEECLHLYLNSGSAVREQVLMLLNDLILLHDSAVSIQDACRLFTFLIQTTNDDSNLVCLAMDVLLDTLLRRIPPCRALDLCISCFTSSDPMIMIISQFLRITKVLTRLICFLDHKLVEKKMIENNYQVIQRLIKQWSSDKVEIRKAVVCCLAQISFKISDRIEPFLKDVKESERKLLQVYVQKISEK